MNTDSQKKAILEEQDIIFQDRQTDKDNNKKNTIPEKQEGYSRRGYKELALNLFERSPEIGHLLVKLHDRNKLYEMAKHPDDIARAELAQTAVDLLGYELEPAEAELIVDVLMGLINQAEKDLRRALSERFAVMQGVPLRLVLKMASDEIFVADPVLRKSVDLKDFDLIYILKAQGKEHWQSIAKRPQISTKVVDMLVDTEDLETSLNILNNKTVSLTGHSVSKICHMAKKSEALAKPLLMRQELPQSFVSDLYQSVGGELKEFIKDNFDNIELAEEALDEVIEEFTSIDVEDYTPTKSMLAHAEMLLKSGVLTPEFMVQGLRCGHVPIFMAQMSVFCSLPISTVEGMLKQQTAQTMAIACKANRIPRPDFINMYLLTSRMRGARVINETSLARAIAYYDKVTEDMAQALMKKYRH